MHLDTMTTRFGSGQAVQRLEDDQLLKGVDYTGLHHFGVVVEDVNEWMDLLMKQGCAQPLALVIPRH